ncbi:C25 family cysteine peptidase [Dyadobacter subterraneus]|uniref:Gingipain domain-containing protein n=1 Tax=Dyadobacter subterraneus TaxID=2773304 RepID=A0ABR9WL42_9BACT|nr:C25 family cysteine peptidase [Dyadobacter subterraneus]MBE9465081.1 hypothetical protein [Dyadobacter subterraneus]
MYSRQTLFYAFLMLISIFSFSEEVCAQTPWSGKYGNEWLSDKYGNEWVKIGVNQSGILNVKLPSSFQNRVGQLHLYHRGVEVALTNVSATEIEFYGVLNDGASDALLYRPYTGVRSNPYYSLYSDESSYFLTYSPATTKMAVNQEKLAVSGTPELYHLQKEVKVYTESDTYDGSQNLVFHALDQSYMVEGKSRSSKAYYKRTGDNPSGNPIYNFQFQLKNLVAVQVQQPMIEILLNGRTFATNKIKASIGKTLTSLANYSSLIEFADFIPLKKQFFVNSKSDIDESGQGFFQLESVQVTDQSATTGIYSVTYTKLEYPQSFNMSGVSSAKFNLVPTPNSVSNVSITNSPVDAKIYDITDPDNPRILSGSYTGTTLNVMISRKVNQELNLLVTSNVISIAVDKVSSISFKKFDPATNDYLIVTNEALYSAANEYSNYRKSSIGGEYKTLLVKIKDIYNQFNYGEPSPVALRRFTDYMIHNAPRSKHNLLLIGTSTTISTKLTLNREIPEDVPTIGFPGSDILLVEGLNGKTTADIPTIPIGRINATNPEQVLNYLSKVIYYDQTKTSYSWKKKILHLNGGKSATEITEFKDFLAALAPIVETGEVGGKVKAIVKQSTIEVEKANISSDVNDGVGMISYMGHGDPTVTDFDMGYMSDAANAYQNFGKYPLMYFNGCGVGNIFNGRNNPSPTASDRLPQSSDWINSSNKGSIAVIANSYYSFQASSSRYLKELYNLIFGSTGDTNLTIGQIQRAVGASIKSQTYSDYDIANIHQSLLQGDPALVLIKVDEPDYTVSTESAIRLYSESPEKTIAKSKTLRTEVVVSNGGKYSSHEMIPVRINYFFADGTSSFVNVSIPAVAFEDTLFFTFDNKKALNKITFSIDPENKIKELNEDNNYSELLIEWDRAEDVNLYPSENLKDIVPPQISVTINNERIKNDAIVSPNPQIGIQILDNRALSADTTLVDVYMKGCSDNSCDFERLSYKLNNIKVITSEDGSLSLTYSSKDLLAGYYELLVSAKDLAGNVTVQSLTLRFQVSESVSNDMNIVASPNPASDYLHFEMSGGDKSYSSLRTVIYDINGNILSTQDVKPELRNWYWIPTNQNSGLYIYKIFMTDSTGQENTISGKVALSR